MVLCIYYLVVILYNNPIRYVSLFISMLQIGGGGGALLRMRQNNLPQDIW